MQLECSKLPCRLWSRDYRQRCCPKPCPQSMLAFEIRLLSPRSYECQSAALSPGLDRHNKYTFLSLSVLSLLSFFNSFFVGTLSSMPKLSKWITWKDKHNFSEEIYRWCARTWRWVIFLKVPMLLLFETRFLVCKHPSRVSMFLARIVRNLVCTAFVLYL